MKVVIKMTSKTKKLILLFSVHIFLWFFILTKLNSGVLYYTWGTYMALKYNKILDEDDK